MKMSEMFPTKWLSALDLRGQTVTVKMSAVVSEKVGDDIKPVLYFLGKEKGLVLNKTNSSTIVDVYGDETANWSGKTISILPAQTEFQGKTVACIRVAIQQSAPVAQAEEFVEKITPTNTSQGEVPDDSDIPF